MRCIRIAVGILSIFTVLCVRNIFDHSPTYDEPTFLHVGEELASGQGWRTEMSVVHAPLSFYTHGLLLKPFRFGSETQRLRWARATMLLYALAMGALVFVWATELFGGPAGILALLMYCFNSNILGHSSLITTDVIHACFSLFLLYFFWRYMSGGGKRWVVASGISLGLALLSKYSAVLWFVLLPAMGAALLVRDSLKTRRGKAVESPGHTPTGFFLGMLAIFLLAILILNIGYGFTGSFAPLGANHHQSRLLATLSDHPLTSKVPVPAPYPFVRGFDRQKYISEVGHPSFMAGMHSTKGWWYYYLACFPLKMPAAFWPILAWAAFVKVRKRDGPRSDAEFILLFSSLAIVGAGSFLSESHAGFRYVLTAVPPLFVLGGAAATDATARWKRPELAALMCLYVAPALWAHPHHIAYFSELVGGPKNGYKWLSDSNLDWGQDLGRAREYAAKSDVPITVNPGMMPVPGRILINATTLQDCFATHDIHGWLRPFKPVDYVGYSWLVFDVNEEAVANRACETGGLPDEYYLGAFEYARDRFQSAEQLARATLAAHPGLPGGSYLLGISRLALGELDEAAEAFDAVPVSHPFYVDARANLSFIAALQGRSDASRTFWKQSSIEDTLRAYAERPTLDVEEYSGLSAADPSDWKLHNNLGVSLWAEGTLHEAEEEIRLTVDIQPNFVEALANLAIVLEERGLFEEALRAQTQYNSDFLLLRASPYRDYRVYYEDKRMMLGDTLEVYPKADEDVLRLKSHLALHPSDVSALNRLAIALMRNGRFGEAYENLSRALVLSPASSALYTNLAVLYTEKNMLSRALDACERAVELDAQNESAARLLSSIRRRLASSKNDGAVGRHSE
jgi:Flp pilus assembly protein TadD/4-amino-4-deoxy-L-arabinose transferase-like glycosyltransferase